MDYEKKYKEALVNMQELYNSMKYMSSTDALHTTTVLERAFPELKENDDERIRKELLNAFQESEDSLYMVLTPHRRESFIAWLEKQGESDETKAKTFLINKGYPIDTNSVFPTYEEMYNIIREGLEKQGNIDKASYEIAEKEKCDFVNGQFIECRKSFDEFKEYNSYWFEYVGNDTYIGRSDNILNKKFHITPRQLYRLFTQEHYCYYPKENNEFEKQMDKGSQVKLPIFTFDDVLALQCCMETVKKVQEDKDLYEKLKCLHGRVYDAYYLEKQGKSKFEQCTQDGDKIVTNEDGTHFNVSQLERVAKKEPNSAWSEEDEENLNQLHKLIVKKAYEEYEIDTEDETLYGKWLKLDNWLKSLKDRFQSHWKPNKEQMTYLEAAIEESNGNCILQSLYNDLKKLI